jgi:hypothetical protein
VQRLASPRGKYISITDRPAFRVPKSPQKAEPNGPTLPTFQSGSEYDARAAQPPRPDGCGRHGYSGSLSVKIRLARHPTICSTESRTRHRSLQSRPLTEQNPSAEGTERPARSNRNPRDQGDIDGRPRQSLEPITVRLIIRNKGQQKSVAFRRPGRSPYSTPGLGNAFEGQILPESEHAACPQQKNSAPSAEYSRPRS